MLTGLFLIECFASLVDIFTGATNWYSNNFSNGAIKCYYDYVIFLISVSWSICPYKKELLFILSNSIAESSRIGFGTVSLNSSEGCIN